MLLPYYTGYCPHYSLPFVIYHHPLSLFSILCYTLFLFSLSIATIHLPFLAITIFFHLYPSRPFSLFFVHCHLFLSSLFITILLFLLYPSPSSSILYLSPISSVLRHRHPIPFPCFNWSFSSLSTTFVSLFFPLHYLPSSVTRILFSFFYPNSTYFFHPLSVILHHFINPVIFP